MKRFFISLCIVGICLFGITETVYALTNITNTTLTRNISAQKEYSNYGADSLTFDHYTASSTTATSTFANGLNLTGGCLEVNGSCFTGGGGGTPGGASSTIQYNKNGTFSGTTNIETDGSNLLLPTLGTTTQSTFTGEVDQPFLFVNSSGKVQTDTTGCSPIDHPLSVAGNLGDIVINPCDANPGSGITSLEVLNTQDTNQPAGVGIGYPSYTQTTYRQCSGNPVNGNGFSMTDYNNIGLGSGCPNYVGDQGGSIFGVFGVGGTSTANLSIRTGIVSTVTGTSSKNLAGQLSIYLGTSSNPTALNNGISGITPDVAFTSGNTTFAGNITTSGTGAVTVGGQLIVNNSETTVGNIFAVGDDDDQLAFLCTSSDTCTTKNNTLDSGTSGNMTILGVFTAHGTATSTITGPLSTGSNWVIPNMATGTESYLGLLASSSVSISGNVGNILAFGAKNTPSITGNSNLIIGQGAGVSSILSGSNNLIVGALAGPNQGSVNLSGNSNTFVGNQVNDIGQTVSGSNNSCFGENTCGVTSGVSNTGIGSGALQRGNTESFDTAVGVNSLEWLGDNQSNSTAVGYDAGIGNSTSHTAGNEALFGIQSGAGLSTGSNNTFIGEYTGSTTSTGANNIEIGYDVENANGTNTSNALDIGNLIYGTGLTSQGTTTSSGSIGIGTTTPENTLSVQGGMSVYTSSATSTIFLDGSLGGGVITRDSAGSGCSELSSIAGVYTGKVIACPF